MWRKFFQTLVPGLVLSQLTQLYAAPPQLNVSASGNNITLSWQDTNNWLQVSGGFKPSVWVNVSNQPTVVGTTNTLVVQASRPAAFYRLVYSPVLPPPTELSVQSLVDPSSDAYFLASWDAVSDATSYNLYYATDPSVTQYNYGSISNGAVIAGITGNSAEISGLKVGQNYFFVATAETGSNESADSGGATSRFGGVSISGEVIGYAFVYPPGIFESAPVSGANVTVSNLSNPAIVFQTRTDRNGEFVFPNQLPGSYQLNATASGYGTVTDTVVLTNTPIVDNLMYPSPL